MRTFQPQKKMKMASGIYLTAKPVPKARFNFRIDYRREAALEFDEVFKAWRNIEIN